MKLLNKLKSIKTKLAARYTHHREVGHYKRFSHIFLNVLIFLDILFALLVGIEGATSSNKADEPKQHLETSEVIRDINYSQDCSGMNVFDYLNIVGSTNIVKTNLSYADRDFRLDISILSNPTYYIYLLDEHALIHKVSNLQVPTLAQHTSGQRSHCIVHYKNYTYDDLVRLTGDTYQFWFITNYRIGSPFSTIPYSYYQEVEIYEKNLHNLAVNSLYMASDFEPYCNIAPTRLSDNAYRFQVYTSGHTMTYTHNTFIGLFYSNNMLYDTLSYEWYNCRYSIPTNFGASVADYFTYNQSGNGHYDFYLKYMKFKTACNYEYTGVFSGDNPEYMALTNKTITNTAVCERQKTITSTGYIYSADCSYSFYNGQHATIKTLCAKQTNPQTDTGCLIDTPNLSSYLDVLKISPDSLGFGASSSLLTGLFGLLTEVFAPVGYFLGLELAPGFYLGYILFAPIVVACMVAIVKMIRS